MIEKRFIDFAGYGPEHSTVKAAIDHDNKVVLIGEYEGNRSTAAINAFHHVIHSVRREEDARDYEIFYYGDVTKKVYSYKENDRDFNGEWGTPDQERFSDLLGTLKEGYLEAIH